jgi:hypothetical protein
VILYEALLYRYGQGLARANFLSIIKRKLCQSPLVCNKLQGSDRTCRNVTNSWPHVACVASLLSEEHSLRAQSMTKELIQLHVHCIPGQKMGFLGLETTQIGLFCTSLPLSHGRKKSRDNPRRCVTHMDTIFMMIPTFSLLPYNYGIHFCGQSVSMCRLCSHGMVTFSLVRLDLCIM